MRMVCMIIVATHLSFTFAKRSWPFEWCLRLLASRRRWFQDPNQLRSNLEWCRTCRNWQWRLSQGRKQCCCRGACCSGGKLKLECKSPRTCSCLHLTQECKCYCKSPRRRTGLVTDEGDSWSQRNVNRKHWQRPWHCCNSPEKGRDEWKWMVSWRERETDRSPLRSQCMLLLFFSPLHDLRYEEQR